MVTVAAVGVLLYTAMAAFVLRLRWRIRRLDARVVALATTPPVYSGPRTAPTDADRRP